MKEELINKIKILCFKNPMYKKIFLSFVKNNENDYVNFEMYENLYNNLIKYNNVLKNNNFNPLDYKNFESFNDNLYKILNKNRIIKLIKNSFSSKYKFLLNEKIYEVINNFINIKLTDNEIKLILTKKLAIYKNPDEFYKYLMDTYNNFSFFSYIEIKKIALENEIKIIYDKDNILVLKIDNFNQMIKVGSPAWCIYRSKKVFSNYIMKKNEYSLENIQLCLCDFNKDISIDESLIGITLENTKIIHAYDKNDKSLITELNSPKYKNILTDIFVNYLNDDYFINEIKNTEIEHYKKIIMLNKYIKDDDVFFKCFKYIIKINNYNVSLFYLKIFIQRLIHIENFKTSEFYFNFIKKYIKSNELMDYLFFNYISSAIYNGNFYKIFEENKNEILNNNLFSSLEYHEKYFIKRNTSNKKILQNKNKNYNISEYELNRIKSVIYFIDFIKNGNKVKEVIAKPIFVIFLFIITKNKISNYIKYIEDNIYEIIKHPEEKNNIFSILTKYELSGVFLNLLKNKNNRVYTEYTEYTEIILERYIKNLLNDYLIDFNYIKDKKCYTYFFDFFNNTLNKMITNEIRYVSDIFIENLNTIFQINKDSSLILLSKIISNYSVFNSNKKFHDSIKKIFNESDIKKAIKMSGNIYLNI